MLFRARAEGDPGRNLRVGRDVSRKSGNGTYEPAEPGAWSAANEGESTMLRWQMMVILAAFLLASEALGFSVRLAPGTYHGKWHQYDALYELLRAHPRGVFEAQMTLKSGPFRGERTRMRITQAPNGTLTLVRHLVVAGKRQVVTTGPPVFTTTPDGRPVAQFIGRMGGYNASGTGQLWVPARWPARVRLRAPVAYSGLWHNYRATYYLASRRGAVYEGLLVLESGPFLGQVTPIRVTTRRDGTLSLVRSVGPDQVQIVETRRPRLVFFGSGGVASYQGPMRGYQGSGTARLDVPVSR